jgi:hypothetical protein
MKARLFRLTYLLAIAVATLGWIWLLSNIVAWFF